MENEKKYTEEEIKAIVDEELRKANLNSNRELNMDEMGRVAGGVVIPSTHEEIDSEWDLVEALERKHGKATTAIFAKSIGLVDSESKLDLITITELRNYMHRLINGEVPML